MRIITQIKNTFGGLAFFLLFFAGMLQSFAQCPTVTNPNQSFCDLQSPTVASLAAVNNGGGISWYANATGGTALSPGAGLVNGEDYFADNAAGNCGSRQVVTVTIYVAPTGLNFQGVCVDDASNATISDLIATGNNIQWYGSPSGGTPLSPGTVLMDNTIYYSSQTNPTTGCETSRLSVFVNVGVVPVPTGNPIQSFCVTPGNTPTVADLNASGNNNNWYLTSSSAVPLSPSTPLVNGQNYYATTVDPPCESITRFEVTVNLFQPSNAGTNGIRRICVNQLSSTPPFNLFGLLGGSPDTTGTWTGPLPTTNGNLGTVNVSTLTLAGSPYTFTYTVNTGVCPSVSSSVTIIVLPLPTATIAANSTICTGSSATVTFTGTPNATIAYTTNPGGNQTITLNASGTATLTGTYGTTTTITLVSASSATTPSCVQTLTGSVTITVLPLPIASVAANATVCSGQPATVTFTGTPNATVNYTASPGGNQSIVLNASGTATITANYSTTTTYTLTSVASAGTPSCVRPLTASIVITVVPPPTVSIASSTTICSGSNATVTFTGTPNAVVTYTSNPGGTQTITLNASGTATLTNTYTVTTTFTLVSVTTSGTPACTSPATGTITITVLPPPTATIAANTTVCSGQAATITITGTPNATVTYTVNPGGTQTITLNVAGTATINGTFATTTTYTLTSITSAGTPSCTQPLTGNITITVVPLPIATISSNVTICPNQTATVTFTGTPNAVITYNANPGGNQTITLNASGTATISGTYTTTTVYTLISATTSGTPSCTQPLTGTITVTVLPLPTVAIASSTTICSGQSATVTFTGTPNAVVTYTTNPGGTQTITLNASGTATVVGTYTATTVFTLVSIATSGTPSCTQPVSGSITITVVPLPVVAIAANSTICSGQSATITFTGTPNAVVTYSVNPGAANQTITLNATGSATISNTFTTTTTYTLVSVASAGTPSCSQPATGTVIITVLPPLTATIASNASICSGASTTVTFTGTPNATITYTTTPGGTQTITLNAAGTASVTGIYTATTVFTLVSISSAGTPSCTQPVSGTITVTVTPLPVVAISSDATVCPNGPASITFTGTPNATVTYTITPGATATVILNAAGTATINDTFVTTTVYTLVSVTTAGTPSCTQPASGTVTIIVAPLPTATIAADATVCPGASATVTFTGTPNATVNYNVNPGGNHSIILNASGTATITNNYAATTVYTLISATSQGTPGCAQPLSGTVTITVVPPPVVAIASSQSVCLNASATVNFTGTPNATVTYNANPGGNQTITLDASGNATLTANYSVTTVYTLISATLSGTPACVQPLTGTITITVVPLPNATISTSTSVCSGSVASIIITGTPNATVNYTANPGGNQNITLNAAGTAVISGSFATTTIYTLNSVIVSGTPACSQTLNQSATVTVVPPPVAGNNAVFSLCSTGSSQDLFLLLGSSAQAGGSWSPALASGTGIFNPAIDPSGIYVYTLAGSPPCPNATASVTVTVVPPANAGSDGSANLCSNSDPVDLTTLLGGNPQTGGTWTPTLASGTSLFNPGVDAAGVYTYTVTSVAPCPNDTATVTISITPGPDAGISGSAAFCQNSPAADLFLSLGGTPQVGGTWSPALSSGTGVFNPAVDTPGIYTYTFSGNQPCDDDTATVTVTVNPIPDAGTDGTAFFCTNYTPADLFANLGGTPQTGGTWSPALASGTGVFDPMVDTAGVYTYTVGGGLCATDTAQITVSVSQSPNAGGNGATLQINACDTNTSVNLFDGLNGSQGAGTWNDDDATGALTGNIFNASQAGAGTYQFTYTVGGGVSPCLTDTATVTVIVNPVPNAGTFNGVQTFCNATGNLDLFSLITAYQTGGDWVDSNNLVVNNNLDISGFAAGTYTYSYVITNPCGTDAEQVQFTIVPTPTLTNSNLSVVSLVCLGNASTINLSGLPDGSYIATYNLSGSNTAPDQTVNVTITGGVGSITIPASDLANTGNTIVTFLNIGNTLTNCVTTLTDVTLSFTVNPLANLDSANLSIANVCEGNPGLVVIAGATGLPNGSYDFNYSITGTTPSTGTIAAVAVVSGAGQFAIPAASLTPAGNYTLTITGIVSVGGCSNLSENATASFVVNPVPNATGASVAAANSICLNSDNIVTISGATNLPDGPYSIDYDLTGANISSQTIVINFTSGSAQFAIPAAQLINPGTTTVTVLQLTLQNTACGISGVLFNSVTFTINQVGTPILQTNGEQFCAADNPTIADLTSNINGSDPIIWYDADTNGAAYNPTDLLVNGNTYYAAYTDISGCSSSIRLEVTVDLTVCEEDTILIPDGFSPNGDFINDAFVIKNLRELYPNFKLEIYNRYGNILYKGNSAKPDWDGNSNEGGIQAGGSLAPVGVYFYILEFNDGVRKPVQGRLYLSR